MISLLDWKCKAKSFNDSLIPENCFCPGIAKTTDRENSESHIRAYYFILSCFTTDILRGKPDSACGMLGHLKDYLGDYQISLSQFINKEGLFSRMGIYYTLIDVETNLYWAMCASGPHNYGYRLLNNIPYEDGFYEPATNRIPEFLQKLEFKCLTKDIIFSEYLYGLFYPNADSDSQKLLMQENWDDINYKLLAKYIKNDIKNKQNAVQAEPTNQIQELAAKYSIDIKTPITINQYVSFDETAKTNFSTFFSLIPDDLGKVRLSLKLFPDAKDVFHIELLGIGKTKFYDLKKKI
jgi:hypothetical protein